MKEKLLILLCAIIIALPASAQLTYKTSWIGNTYPGGDSYTNNPVKAHVQNYIENIWVNRDATDGKVFTTAKWDEGDREKSIIQNGQVIGRMPDPGHNVQHDAITGDGTYIYISMVIDRGGFSTNGYGMRRFNLDGSAAPLSNGVGFDKSWIEVHNTGTDVQKTATAIAVNTGNKELYYADPVDGNIKVINLNTNTVIASFGIGGISYGNNRIAVATDGNLWWLVRQDKKVYRYSNRGTKQAQEVTGIQDPATICIDKNNKLYVADNGTSLQIKVYNNINSSPTFEKSIGNDGGIYSGNRGEVGDMKFHPGMAGLGTDGNGNVYLATNGVDNSTGSILKSINASGSGINWQLYGLAFVDNFDIDPSSDGLDVYGRTEHFKMDYSKSSGQEWSYKGYTVDKAANPGDGARGDGTAIIRNRDGRKFMYTIGMYAGGLNLYRFDLPPSEIAVPLGVINRDGGWAWEVDNNCDVWSAGQGGKVRRYEYPGIALNYNTAAPEEWAIPAPFNAVERVKYIAETDVLYLSGWSASYPNSKGDWGRVGRVICKYNNWKGGNRTANATMVLDYTNQEAPKSLDIAGDYAFVTACKEEKTWVYRISDGGLAGIFTPGPEVNNKSGWVDISYGTRAFKRSNGEYIILNEEDLFGKVIMYRWCPSGNCSNSVVAVTGVSVSPTTASVTVGSTTTLTATISPSNASNKNVTWTSSNSAVATVNNTGVVSGVATGTATITVTTQDGSKTATSTVTVTSGTVAVTGVSVSPTSASVAVGSTTALTATVSPSNASNKNVAWSTNNASVATVNSSGLVSGVAAGTATITVTTQDGSKTATSTITVTAPAGTPDLIVTDITQAIVSGSTVRFSAVVKNQGTGATPSGTILGVAFSVSGTVTNWEDTYTTSLAPGASVTLTATGGPGGVSTWNATSANYTVQAFVDDVNRITESNDSNNTFSKALTTTGGTVAVTGVSVSPTTASITVGGTQQLTATITPSNATNQSVSWSSSNTSVATVSSSGLVKAVAAGTATITVTTADGGKTATSTITVTAPSGNPDLIVTDITQTIVSGSTVRFSAVVKNQGTGATSSGTILGVAFSVSGTVTNWEDTYTTSLAAGASVTLTATGGPSGVSTWNATSANYTVQAFVDDVNRITESNESNNTFSKALTTAVAVTGVTVSPTTASIAVGGTQQLTATVSPSNASNQSVSWSSSNTSVATVNSSGLVTAVAAGTSTITVTTADGSKTTTSAITVTGGGTAAKLTGTVLTNVDPYGTGVGSNAFDNNTSTFVDAKQTSGAYTGLNFGSSKTLTSIKYFPRAGQEARMNGGKFQGSTDGTTYVDLYTISAAPPAGWTTVTVSGIYTYARYINNAANTYCNVAEIEFWGTSAGSRLAAEETESTSVLTVYPNPANSSIEINHFADEAGEAHIDIMNELGQSKMNSKFKLKQGSNKLYLDISNLNTGLHYIRFNSGRQTVVKKLMISK